VSNASHGGKGDRNRSNNTSFRTGWDAIFAVQETISDEDYEPVEENNIECMTPSKKAFLDQLEMKSKEREVLSEIIKFLEHIDLEEYPVQKAKELYKKFLTLR
jgi:hypothetical protein